MSDLFKHHGYVEARIVPAMPSKEEIERFKNVLKDRVDALLAKVDLIGADRSRRQRIADGLTRSLLASMREMDVTEGKVTANIVGDSVEFIIKGNMNGFRFNTKASTQPALDAPEEPEFPTAYDKD